MKKGFIFLLFIFLLQACAKKHNRTGFRIVGNDGRVIYFDKKRPSFNEEQLNKKRKSEEINPKKTIQSINNKNNTNKSEYLDSSSYIATESSAYTLKSVMDSITENDESKMLLAKKLEKQNTQKTINDFDYIPEYYFNDGIENKNIANKEIIKSEISQQNVVEQVSFKNKNDSKVGFFAKIFGKKNKSEEDINKTKTINKRLKNKNNIVTTDKINNNTTDEQNNTNKELQKVILNKNQKTGKSILKEDLKKIEKNIEDKKELEKNNTVKIYNLNSKTNTKENKTKAENDELVNNAISIDKLNKNKYYIQLGSFLSQNKAKILLDKFPNIGTNSFVVMVNINGKLIFRSIIGEFKSKIDAEKEMEKIIIKGHYDVYIFKK